MKLTTVIASVDNSYNPCNTCVGTGLLNKNINGQNRSVPCWYCNGEKVENPFYYQFIPSQIKFWSKFGIRFLAIFVGKDIPQELQPFKDNIILWNKNLDIKTAYVGQHLRIYYPALLDLPDDELVMITDMDMLPMNPDYFTKNIFSNKENFVYYRNLAHNQIFMCYNAAHPKVWSKIFNVKNENDLVEMIYKHYNPDYQGLINNLWYSDQILMFDNLIKYPHLKVLNRSPKRLEFESYEMHLKKGDDFFIHQYDDGHFHRRFDLHKWMILDAYNQLNGVIDKEIRNICIKEIDLTYLKVDYYKENDIFRKQELKDKIKKNISELLILPKFIKAQLPNVAQNFFDQDSFYQ